MVWRRFKKYLGNEKWTDFDFCGTGRGKNLGSSQHQTNNGAQAPGKDAWSARDPVPNYGRRGCRSGLTHSEGMANR